MKRPLLTVLSLTLATATLSAQTTAETVLPTAPNLQLSLQSAQMQMGASSADNPPANGSTLTRSQAERLAIRNNPRISVGKLLALAQGQSVREARAGYLPTVNGEITALDAENASRISAGGLTSSRLLTHAGAGVNLSQLVTDFGRTHNLVLTQKLEAKATNAGALATTEEIVLATDQAFYSALTAQALLEVAKQTVATRNTTENLVSQLTQNKLRSTLDLSFAQVNASQAQLLQLDAQNNSEATMAALDAVLGLDHSATYTLADDTDQPPAPPQDVEALIQRGLQQRPDLQSLEYGTQSAQKFARAQWDQLLPSISVAGTAGLAPIRVDQYYVTNWWGGIGVNMSIPIFNGFLYSAQAKEASYRARADAEDARDLRDQIVRDVRTAWLQDNTAYQRLSVTAQLLQQANLALQLAQTRYKLGLSSIVELSQAQLQQTTAQIDATNAQYQYRLSMAALNYEVGNMP
jgi:outer membrane protein